jgi:serine protease Do
MKPQAISTPFSKALEQRRQLLVMAFFSILFILVQAFTAQARPESLAPLAEKISPSVVNITTSALVEGRVGPRGIVPEGSPLQDLFPDLPNGQGERSRRSSSLGSGFVISEDGFIVTNDHVIKGADEILIEFFPGEGQPKEQLVAKVIGTDPNTDIALLKVEADQPLAFVRFGDSDTARVGDWVIAMGNPLGQGFSVSAGIVSARGRTLNGAFDDYIQTDAAINKGNSGGPLFNMDGDVIGVNTAILSPDGGSIGIGFSMASNVVTKVVDQLKEFGETRRGWLGVQIQNIDEDLVEGIAGLDTVRGALISEVFEGGPSDKGGLKVGDVILSFDGQDVADVNALVRIVGNSDVGKSVRVVVLRNGATETLRVTLGRREDAQELRRRAQEQEEEATPKEPEQLELLGLTLTPLTEEMRAELGIAEGISGLAVVAVDEASEAFEKGLRAGDVITEAGQQKIDSLSGLQARMQEAKDAGRKSLLLLIRRGSDPRFVALNVPQVETQD